MASKETTMAGVARRRRLVAATLAVTVLVVAAGNAIGVAAQIGAPPAPPACSNFMLALSPCLSYVTGLDSTSNPICCAAFSAAAINAPACLCQFFSASSPLGIPMNLTRVRNLPQTCNMNASSIPQCTDPTVPFKPPAAGLPATPPNAVPGSIPASPAKPPASFLPSPPTTGSPIPAPVTPSASSPLPFIRLPPPPPDHNTPNSSTGGSDQSNPAAKTKASVSASSAGALSRPSAMGVCFAVFLATRCFM